MVHLILLLLRVLMLFQGISLEMEVPEHQKMFVWDIELVTEENIEELKEDGFDTLYIYLTSSNRKDFYEVLELCDTHMMSVYALNGSYEWIDSPDEQEDFFKQVSKVVKKEYDSFKGIILDIEPYVSDADDDDYAIFTSLILDAKAYAEEEGLVLNIVVPFWYEKIDIDATKDHENLSEWIINHADEVSIMAYRNNTDGSNGIISLIEDEIAYSLHVPVELVVILETRPSSEGEHISFSEIGRTGVSDTISTLKRQFMFYQTKINYGVHDIEYWLELEE